MAEPVCAQKGPYALELTPGDYWWCACGQSKKQPFCDGSHKVTAFVPVKFTRGRSRKEMAVRLQALEESAVLRRHAQVLL